MPEAAERLLNESLSLSLYSYATEVRQCGTLMKIVLSKSIWRADLHLED